MIVVWNMLLDRRKKSSLTMCLRSEVDHRLCYALFATYLGMIFRADTAIGRAMAFQFTKELTS